MSLFAELVADAAKITNEVMGEVCTYRRRDGSEIQNVTIIIQRNKVVKDNYSNIIGYADQAVFLKSQLGQRPNERETFIDPNGNEYRVGQLVKESSQKWYFEISEF